MVSPAIHFMGNCAEAISLYEKAFNATDKFVDYAKNAPEGSGISNTGEKANWIMHSGLNIYGTLVNFCDSDEDISAGNAICLNVYVPDAECVRKAYDELTKEGKAVVEIGPQFFSPMYASITDKFGIKWQIIS